MRNAFLAVTLAVAQIAAAHIVTGFVRDTAAAPLPGVAVSDGQTITETDSTGRFTIESETTPQFVFVTTPDGYEPAESLGNRPRFWLPATGDPVSRADFVLRKTARKPLALIVIADMQISNRQGDLQRLRDLYLPDINRTVDSLRTLGREPLVLTLGDQTCEYYWYDNGFGPADFNAAFAVNAPVYHTMGNHDHDPWLNGDHDAATTWHAVNGPSYYSFNRDGCHFVVLDNIVYDSSGGSPGQHGTRKYHTGLTDKQLQWLAADLERVADKDAPLFLAMHGVVLPYPKADGALPAAKYRFTEGTATLDSLLRPFSRVTALTGHAHNMHLSATPDGRLREYNYAAACGTWWPARFLPLGPNFPLCADGTPWGYGIWDFDGDVPLPSYKPFGGSTDDVMRVYDLGDAILANIWVYEPGDKVEFFEDGNPLPVRQVKAQDPAQAQLVAASVKAARGEVHKSLLPEKTAHMFRAVPTRPASRITVVHTDRFGRRHTTTAIRIASY